MKCACGKREIDPTQGCGHGGQQGGCGCGKKKAAQESLADGRPQLGLRAAE